MIELLATSPVTRAVGTALLHFVWQGALIGLVAGALLYAFRRRSASVRYAIGCLALAAMALAPVLTAVGVYGLVSGGLVDAAVATASAGTANSGTALAPMEDGWWTRLIPVVVLFWMVGVLLMTTHLVANWMAVRRLWRSGTPVGAPWRDRARRLADDLGISRLVTLSESGRIEVPTLVGWVRPVILVPASVLAGLTPSQLDAVLTHELAHIRRHDYLVNVLQSVVETLLFYHPAVWWVSHRVRIEREHCCDDVAVAVSGDRVAYVRALASLEELRGHGPALGLAANDGDLLGRVRRLLGASPADQPRSTAWGVLTVLFVMVPVLVFGLGRAVADQEEAVEVEQEVTPVVQPVPVTVIEVPEVEVSPVVEPVPTGSASPVVRPDVRVVRVPTPEVAVPVAMPSSPAVPATPVELGVTSPVPVPEPSPEVEPVPAGPEAVTPSPAAVIGGRPTQVAAGGQRQPMRIGGAIAPPKKVLHIDPVYPAAARAARVQGLVIMEAVIDEQGFVTNPKILRSAPMLDGAAVDAVLQWRYEPPLLNGVPVPVIMTVTVNFRLSDADRAASQLGSDDAGSLVFVRDGDRLRLEADASNSPVTGTRPRKILDFEPSYPLAAREAEVEGTVILRATIDEEGFVRDPQVVRSVPMLDEAAIDAVLRWRYEPAVVGGEPTAVEMRIAVSFNLDDDQRDGAIAAPAPPRGTPVRVGGIVAPPTKIRDVAPVYPQIARDNEVEGLVIMEATINEQGAVTDVRVLRSTPMLDQAAIDAVRQWRYAPPLLNGAPTSVVMTVTVNFTLN